jgi:hypothetical protein
MSEPKARRITRSLTPEEQDRLRRQREQVVAELPDLTARDRMRKEAGAEPTLSGALRRAIHASQLALTSVAARAGVTPLQLDEFLTGERTLRSDVFDRLAAALGFELQAAK